MTKQRTLALSLLLVLFLVQNKIYGQCKLDYDPAKWKPTLIFEDNFDTYQSANELNYLNGGKYKLDDTRCGQKNCFTWDHVNLTPEGYLRLTAEKRISGLGCDDGQCSSHTMEYNAGGIQTTGSIYSSWFHSNIPDSGGACGGYTGFFKFSLFEIRCKLPSISGAKASFWFYNGSDEYDVFETTGTITTNFHDRCGGEQTYVFPTVTSTTCPQQGHLHRACQITHPSDRDLSNDFHTYSLVWTMRGDTMDVFTIFIDGREIRTETRYKDFDCPINLILSSRRSYGNSTKLSELLVDYIKVWEQEIPKDSYMYKFASSQIRAKEVDWYMPQDYRNINIGENDEIFFWEKYDGISGEVSRIRCLIPLGNGQYDLKEISSPNDPDIIQIDGDMVVGGGNQIFYRGKSGRIQTYRYSNGLWKHDYIDRNWTVSDYKVSSVPRSLAVHEGNKIYYAAVDNRIHGFIYDSTNGWQHETIDSPLSPSIWEVKGDVVVGVGNQIYYHGSDNRVQTYQKNSSGWNHNWIDRNWSLEDSKVSSTSGSLAVGEGNRIYVRTINNEVYKFFYPGSGNWKFAPLPSELMDEKVGGQISVCGNEVYYRGSDGKMQRYYERSGAWLHDWLNEDINASNKENVRLNGNLVPVNINGQKQIFYHGLEDDIRVFTKESCIFGEKTDLTCGSTSPFKRYDSENNNGKENLDANRFNKEISDGHFKNKILIHPNPFNSKFQINTSNLGTNDIKVSIFGQLGQKIFDKNCSQCQDLELDLTHHPSGVYNLIIRVGNKSTIKRVIKN